MTGTEHSPALNDAALSRSEGGRAALLLALLGASVYLASATGELWIDEVWSLDIALNAKSVASALAFHHDNSHPLNTVILHLLGSALPDLFYRLPAVLFGALTLALLAGFARRVSALAAYATLALAIVSFPLAAWFSEARGYAPAMFFGVAAFYALEKRLNGRGAGYLWLFWLATALGLLSHLTYVLLVPPFALHAAYRLFLKEGNNRGKVRELMLAVLPAFALAAFVYFHYADMIHGPGGGASSPLQAFGALGRELLGLGILRVYPFFALALYAAAITAAALVIKRAGGQEWLFMPAATLLSPLAVSFLLKEGDFYLRFFVVTAPFAVLAFGQAAALLWQRRKGAMKWAAAGAFAIVFLGSAARTVELPRLGRSHYAEALKDIAALNRGEELISASGNYSTRDFVMLEKAIKESGLPFKLLVWNDENDYLAHIPGNHYQLNRVRAEPGALPGPRFLIAARDAGTLPPGRVLTLWGRKYDFFRDYPVAEPAGEPMSLYVEKGK